MIPRALSRLRDIAAAAIGAREVDRRVEAVLVAWLREARHGERVQAAEIVGLRGHLRAADISADVLRKEAAAAGRLSARCAEDLAMSRGANDIFRRGAMDEIAGLRAEIAAARAEAKAAGERYREAFDSQERDVARLTPSADDVRDAHRLATAATFVRDWPGGAALLLRLAERS